MAGRKKAGFFWFLVMLMTLAVKFFTYFSPAIKSYTVFQVATVFHLIVWVVMLADSCRQEIPRIKAKVWVAYVLLFVVIILLPILIVRQCLFQPFKIPSHSMEPTLMGNLVTDEGIWETGDHILISKMAYWFHPPQRGDLVVHSTEGVKYNNLPPNVLYLKRVVGIPGETISVKAPNIFVNGKRLDQPPIFQKITSGEHGYNGYVNGGLLASESSIIVLGKDEYFVCGDNGTNSLDSRYFGALKKANIKGKVILIYFPFERKGIPE